MLDATVIGSNGFIGKALSRYLRDHGVTVHCPKKNDSSLLTAQLGVVFYCAGLTADFLSRPFDTVRAHSTNLSELVEFCNFDRLIYLSSTRLYDGSASLLAQEGDYLQLNVENPRSLFDLSKAVGEHITLTQTGGRGTVARLANVFSFESASQGFLSEWFASAEGSPKVSLNSSPHTERDYIHIADVVEALIKLAVSKENVGIVNLASGELTSNRELANVFSRYGWEISFQSTTVNKQSPVISIRKLLELGIKPKRATDLINRELEGRFRWK